MMSAFIHFYSRYFYKTVVVVQYSSTSATTSLLFIFFSETNRNGGSATERATQLKREHFLETAGEQTLGFPESQSQCSGRLPLGGRKKEDEKRRRLLRPFDIYRAGGGEL